MPKHKSIGEIKWRKDGYGTQRVPTQPGSPLPTAHIKIWFNTMDGRREFVDRAYTMKQARERILKDKELPCA